MLEYFYTCDCTESETPLATLSILTYHLADKHLLAPLKDLASAKFARELDGKWDQPVFTNAVFEVYTYNDAATDNALKDIVIAMAKDNFAELFGCPSKYPNFHVVAQTTLFFAAAVASKVASEGAVVVPKGARSKRYKCLACPLGSFVYDAANYCPYHCIPLVPQSG